MIVRILGEAQYEVPNDQRPTLNDLDDALLKAVDAGDEVAFGTALQQVTAEVRSVGTPLPADQISPSDLVVPFPDASLAETKELLADGPVDEER